MNLAERKLYEALKDFRYTQNRIAELSERLAESTYRITPAYSLTPGGGGEFTSKVENAALRQLRILDELDELHKTESDILEALHNAPLTRRERGLAESVMCGYSLAEYARTRGLYISNVYKVRDKTLQKMVFYLQNRA